MSGSPETAIFVLRFWREPGAPAEQWRGHLEHVTSGKRFPIPDLARLRPLVEQHLNDPRVQPDAPGPNPSTPGEI